MVITYHANKEKQRGYLSISIIIILVVLFLYVSYRDSMRIYNQEMELVENELERVVDDVDEVIEIARMHLNILNDAYIDHYIDDERLSDDLISSYESIEGGYYLSMHEGRYQSSVSGLGNFDSLSRDEYKDILTSASLNQLFYSTNSNIEDAVWIYYISKNEFINIFPYLNKEVFRLQASTMELEFYQMVLPANNPSKAIISTHVYLDEAGKGLMLTLSKPVYVNHEFMGAIAIDFTLETMNEVVQHDVLSKAKFLLINGNDEVIADEDEVMTRVVDYKDWMLKHYNAYDVNTSDRIYTLFNNQYIIHSIPTDNFNWRLVSVVASKDILSKIIRSQLLLLTLLLLLLLSIILTLLNVRSSMKNYSNQLLFSQVIDQAVQLMAVLSTDGKILFVNKAALGLLEEDFEVVKGKYFYEASWWTWSDDLVQFIKDAISICASGGHAVKDVIHYDQEGNEKTYEFSLNPIINQRNKVEYLVANGKDITDRVLLKESMDRLLKSDVLTGLGNRRAIFESLEKEISRYNREHKPFSLLLCDVDFFKNVNDTYGHNVGDEVLIEISQQMLRTIRNYDSVARWGGEEFIVVLPNTAYKEALAFGERLKEDVEKLAIQSMTDPSFNHVTLTVGVTYYDPKFDLLEIIKQADDAMYDGKKKGRNRVVGYYDI